MMDRRTLLSTISAASVATLAGCQSSGDGSSPTPTTVDGPAQFTDFRLEGPSETSVPSDPQFTISAHNIGSEPGSYSGQVLVESGASDAAADFELTDIPSGERGETTVTLSFEVADDLTLGFAGSDIDHTTQLSVRPESAAIGETLTFDEALEVTLDGVSIESSLFYVDQSGYGDDTRRLLPAPSGRKHVIFSFSLENVTTSRARLATDTLELSDGELYTNDGRVGALEGVSGDLLNDVAVESGQSISGYLVALVPQDALENGLVLGYQRDARDTRPEKQWALEPRGDLPSFELADWPIPSSTDPGQVPMQLTVRNKGGGAGTFRGSLSYQTENQSRWSEFKLLSAEVAGGETHSFEFTGNWGFTTNLSYRFNPFGEDRSVEMETPDISAGTTVSLGFGMEAAVTDLYLTETYTTRYQGYEDEDKTYDDDIYALAVIEGTYGADGAAPRDYEFTIQAGDVSRDIAISPPSGTVVDPAIQAPFYREPLDADAGAQFRGVLKFQVPSDTTKGDVSVVYDTTYTGTSIGEVDSEATWNF